jgi:ribosomal protein S18 acetylase RimI-like enzyme
MDLIYFKRYRMEITLAGRDLAPLRAPEGYRFDAWSPALLDAFAEAKYLSFRGEIDANVFPCLGELDGCRRLMNEIVRKPGFLPETTWLLTYGRGRAPGGAPSTLGPGRRPEFCGTVQGIRDVGGLGAIQNLGIAPEHRNGGLGTVLLFQALQGFRRAGIGRVYLEVTAQNEGALRLYRRLGFVTVKTVYKAVEHVYS